MINKIHQLNIINKTLSLDKNKIIKKMNSKNKELDDKILIIKNNYKIKQNKKKFKKRIISFEQKFMNIYLKHKIHEINKEHEIKINKLNKKMKNYLKS